MLRPLRVLLATDTLHTGGMEEMIGQLARQLRQLEAEVAILCVKDGGATARRLSEQGIRVHLARGDAGVMRDVLRAEGPAVIGSHLAELALLEAAAELGIPVVETVHNTYIWFDHDAWQREARRSRHFARLAAVSALARAYYAKWNPTFSADRMTVVPNSVEPDRLPPVDRAQARRELLIAEEETVFLSLAAYSPQKNQFGLMTAFDRVARRHPRIRLLCAGEAAHPHYAERVARHRESLPSRDRIELHPHRQDVNRLLSAADVFVLNSAFEGWSVAATEALVSGLPLIHADCGSARELVGAEGERGIVVPNPVADPLDLTLDLLVRALYTDRQRNSDALVEALGCMVDERALWRGRAEEIRAQARAAFGGEESARRYRALLQQAAEQAP